MTKKEQFKIRVFDIEYKKYLKSYDNYDIDHYLSQFERCEDGSVIFLEEILDDYPKKYIIERSTGFIDFNDNLLFEGDIVKSTDGYFRKNVKNKIDIKTGKIKFRLGCFFVEWVEDSGRKPLYKFDYNILGDRKILHKITKLANQDINKTMNIKMTKKHAKLSASGSSKWLNCPGSVEAESKIPNKQSVYAEEGTLAHELADICLKNYINSCTLNNDYKSALDRIGETIKCESDKKVISTIVTDEMAKFVQEYIDYVLAHETKNSQLYTEDKVDFSNIVPDGFGTMDAAIFDYDTGICHIFDLKYGQGVTVDAVENTQAQLYALGFYNELKCLDVIKSFKIHIVQPRIFNYSSWEITLDDLFKFGEYASKKANEALMPNAPRIPGEKQCKWCKAKATCPALKKHTEDTILENFENLNNKNTMLKKANQLNDEQLKLILDNKNLIKDFLKSVEQHVYDRVSDGKEFEGYKLVEGRSNRKWADNAEEILKNKLGEDAYEKKLIGITAAKKKLKKDEVEELTYKPEGKLELAPVSDKRKEVINTTDHFDKI